MENQNAELEATGRELWPRLIGNCPAVIVAELEQNESESQSDYFGSRTIARVILAPSKHTRDIFSEMRKAADKLPETAHLGTGKGRFIPRVVIVKAFVSNGACYWEGQYSPWHRELDKDENYQNRVFTTREEAEAYIQAKGEPYSVTFDGEEIPFTWKIGEEEIEHREKYSMGHGYYLGVSRYSGWQVSKQVLYKGGPSREDYITLARRYDHLMPKPQAPKSEGPAPRMFISRGKGYEVTQERDWTWVKFPSRPTDEVLETLRANGGRWGKKRQAWYFTRPVSESEVSAWLCYGSPAPSTDPAPAPAYNPAQSLREKADAMQKAIDDKLNPAIGNQNYTARRARIAEGMRKEGYHLEKVQAGLRALADAHDAGAIPASLAKITTKKAVEELIWKNDAELMALMEGKTPDRQAEEKRRALETEARRMVGLIPGYFPTPREIVSQMLDLAEVQEGDSLLEPEAGAGAIAEEARARGAEVDTIEYNYTLCDLLKAKGFDPIGHDFLEMSPNGKRYNKIVMNPPFEHGQDVKHVQHAYDFLSEGGCLVSVMSEGTFFRDDRAPFREWVSTVGYDVDLPAGAFEASGTGVKTRLVVITKPQETPKLYVPDAAHVARVRSLMGY